MIVELLFAQKEHYVWYFGDFAGIDFNSGAPVVLSDGLTNTYEGCATICDPNGNLLFYTDGVSVWDSSHLQMPNGNALDGGFSATQSALIIPFPGNNMLYYIFTVNQNGVTGNLKYSVVDMSLNNGNGDITIKNSLVLASVYEKLTAVKHANNVDTWVMVHGTNDNAFYCFLVNSTGLSLTPVVSNIGPVFALNDNVGYMKYSPDGGKIAIASFYGYYVDLFDFSSTSGIVSNEKMLTLPAPTSNGVYGIEYSNNGSYLYATLFSPGLIVQWDISSNNDSIINASFQQVGVSTAGNIGALQLAPDGKIYVALRQASYLGVINYPDSSGILCNYVDYAISLSGICQIGLPNFITSYSLPTTIASETHQSHDVSIYPNPFTTHLEISIQKQIIKQVSVSIVNIFGLSVFGYQENIVGNNFTRTIDLSYLSKGIYLCEVIMDGKRTVNKIVME